MKNAGSVKGEQNQILYMQHQAPSGPSINATMNMRECWFKHALRNLECLCNFCGKGTQETKNTRADRTVRIHDRSNKGQTIDKRQAWGQPCQKSDQHKFEAASLEHPTAGMALDVRSGVGASEEKASYKF